jgi:hypothetical protein
VCTGSLNTMETTIRIKQYGGEIILPNLTSEAGAKTYGPPCNISLKMLALVSRAERRSSSLRHLDLSESPTSSLTQKMPLIAFICSLRSSYNLTSQLLIPIDSGSPEAVPLVQYAVLSFINVNVANDFPIFR